MKRLLRGLLLLAVVAGFVGGPAWCQAPPPPPPAEGLDPSTAPQFSTPDEEHGHGPGEHTHAPHQVKTPRRVSPSSPDGLPHGDADAHPHALRTVFGLDFMQRALVTGMAVAAVCAFLGIFVVLRRIVFVGVALAQMSSAGVALALLAGSLGLVTGGSLHVAPMAGSVMTMLLGVGLISVNWAPKKVRQDAFIGIGYVVASASTVLLLAKSAQGEGHLLDLLLGNVLLVSTADVVATLVALGGVLAVHLVFAKELLFVSFDPDTAQASGYSTRFWEAVLYITVGLAIAFAIHAAGILLTFGSLVIPAVTGLLVTRRMRSAFLVAVAAGVVPVPIGLYLSFVLDLPTAATIVAIGFLLLLVAGASSRLRPA